MAVYTIDQLRTLCSECEDLYSVLRHYTGCEKYNDIIAELKCNDTLWSMADQNDTDEDTMLEWIDSHISSSVECRVFQEHGPAGSWPVVEIKCLDMVFYLDWVLDTEE